MTRKPKAIDLWRMQMTFLSLAAEAQTVIALRTMGMLGLWNTSAGENKRMVAEKTEAFTKSAIAAGGAIARGASPHQIALAGMRPLRAKTKPNVARLTKAGPKSPF
jgi:hypothetical protein